ncbi:MAG: hypothetical protein HOV81_07935 [Kofleriaceae bacterium]|nr:hypothetical protein [Kofleriaceae bacterium]
MLRRTVRWVWERPLAQLVGGSVFVALAFPASSAGSIALAILAGVIGVALVKAWPAAPAWLKKPGRIATVLVLVAVPLIGLEVFWETLTVSPDWQLGDWGPQHAVLARIMPSLPGGDVPVWNHAVSTGDAPLELYPAMTYLVTGHLAAGLGLEHDLPLAFMIMATLVHLALATITTALALRVASRKVALVVGLAWLVDGGAISHGGSVGLFHWAILHSTFAHVFSMIAVLGILGALRRPRLGASLAIWLGTAIATATHPAALLTAGVSMLALLGVALLASDVPPRRALVAAGHVALGIALGAIVWLPSSERLLLYGQHFSNELYTAVRLLQTVMSFAMPITVYSLIVYAGYLGLVIGLVSRRAELVFISIVSFVMLVGLADVPYLGLGVMPGPETARLGVVRMMLLVRPFVYVGAAYMFSLVGAHLVESFRAAKPRQKIVLAALLGVVGGVGLRVMPAYWQDEQQRAYAESREFAADPSGRKQLTAWAREQVAHLGPGAWARALFEQTTHEQQHLTAITGLPTLHMGALPDLLLRERIEDTSPESLARFNVRWVVGVGQSPTLGDPETEISLGSYRIRELPTWDGKFARIEKGAGNVAVTRLDDRAVEIVVTGTTEPVLVALGTGFYPRWRARHESGAAEPVYALPSIPGGQLHVVSAWVAPGRTTFTVDGPLPSDGDGRGLALAALAMIIAGIVTWSRPRWRIRVLRELARVRRRVLGASRSLLRATASVVVLVLVIRGCDSAAVPMRALTVGSGVRASAKVEARLAGAWVECDYLRIRGEYDCDGLVTVSDATANILNDAPPSWPFTTPAIVARAYGPGVEVRITRSARLIGRYWAQASNQGVQLVLDKGEPLDLTTRQVFRSVVKRRVTITGGVPFPAPLSIAVVLDERLEPPRPFLAPPPDEPPPSVRAIH